MDDDSIHYQIKNKKKRGKENGRTSNYYWWRRN